MYLYNLTLNTATGIQIAVYGNFSGPKSQEVIVSKDTALQLLRPSSSGHLDVILTHHVFGHVRSMAPFRLTGMPCDMLAVGSDSGRIVILEYNAKKNCFVKIHQETFGRSGLRRVVPGHYLAVDPKGRAVTIGAVEKQKFVYILNRDSEARLTISSPLEAHKSGTLLYALTHLDVGFDNPMIAAIELDYTEADQDPSGEAASEAQKVLTFYELDLGLNHVVRKYSEPVDNGANRLIAVPGGADGPGGVLICAENFVIYKNQGHPDVRAVIPRRSDLPPERGVLITTSATHKQKNVFFFLLASEYGDIYKATLQFQGQAVHEVQLKYFDSIPPPTSICVFRTGFLFAASEFGNHTLYKFEGIGDDDAVESSSRSLVETVEGYQAVYFTPRPLTNLSLTDTLHSLAPITNMQVVNLTGDDVSQVYVACGRGCRSTFRSLKPGLQVAEMAAQALPGQPQTVWTIKKNVADEFDQYIIVSFTNATLVLSIGETVEEVSDSGLLGTTPTLRVQLLADSGMVQVHPGGLRHIRADRRVNEWKAPSRKEITMATSNEYQVIIALSGGDLMYFELDTTGQLQETLQTDMKQQVLCLAVGALPEGRTRSRYLAVGLPDATVKVLGLDPGDNMRQLTMQSLDATPGSLLFQESVYSGADVASEAAPGLFLHVGLANGVLLRIQVDPATGTLSDTRQRFLGLTQPGLFPVTLRGKPAFLALSSRPWLGFSEQGRHQLAPLAYDQLESGHSFSSEVCPEGLVLVAGQTLRIVTIDRLVDLFTHTSCRLRYTPRRMALHPAHRLAVLAEADHQAVPLRERTEVEELLDRQRDEGGLEGPEFDEEHAELEEQVGVRLGQAGQWASCLRVIEPTRLQTLEVQELDANEAAISLCIAEVASPHVSGHVLVVGTVSEMQVVPRGAKEGAIRLYRFGEGGGLELIHKTKIDGIPGSVCGFQGRILAGVGPIVRLYDIGKKQLLRKCEYRALPSFVHSLQAQGSRIYAADQQESFAFMKYRKAANQFYVYADTVTARHVTAMLWLDYDTLVGGDKFGNVFVSRLPEEVSEEVERDPTGGKFVAQSGALNGAPHKLDDVVNFHVGDVVTALSKATLLEGGQEVIVYATISGGLGVLLPFSTRSEADMLLRLELHMRLENPPLLGRDHLAFRSCYVPVKDVVDGDLCEQFASLSLQQRKEIAESMQRTPGEILRVLEELRNRVM